MRRIPRAVVSDSSRVLGFQGVYLRVTCQPRWGFRYALAVFAGWLLVRAYIAVSLARSRATALARRLLSVAAIAVVFLLVV